MALELQENALYNISGVVEYPSAFLNKGIPKKGLNKRARFLNKKRFFYELTRTLVV